MISQLEGELRSVAPGSVELAVGAVVYRLLVLAMDEQALANSVGETMCFFTFHYLEGQGQGSSYIPRLIGFRTSEARAFFELFTTVKGLGARKALRSMALPVQAVATAIARKDLDLLKSLPEIGKRTAETIVAELHGKVDQFVEMKPERATGGTDTALIADAVAVLVQLGESRVVARQLVDRVLAVDETITTPEELVAAAYRIRG